MIGITCVKNKTASYYLSESWCTPSDGKDIILPYMFVDNKYPNSKVITDILGLLMGA